MIDCNFYKVGGSSWFAGGLPTLNFYGRHNCQCLPALMSEGMHGGNVLFEYAFCFGESRNRTIYAGLAQKMQDWIRRAVCIVFDIVNLRIGKLVLRMKTGDLDFIL